MLPIDIRQLKALIIDVDGTLYRQGSVRRAMFWRLLLRCLGQPTRGLLELRVLSAYRKAQEALRARPSECGDVASTQLRLACEQTGIDSEVVRLCIARWMEQEPLEIVARFPQKELREFLQDAREFGLRLAALSDYPPATKLSAMGLSEFFDIAVSAQDPEVQRFKPNPRGLEVTLRRLGVNKDHALYIGDRPEVDAVAAYKAGIGCVIIGRRCNSLKQHGYVGVSGYRELRDAISSQLLAGGGHRIHPLMVGPEQPGS